MPAERSPRMKVLAFMEAQTVTGPAKNLIEFGRLSSEPSDGLPAIDLTVATFRRPGASNQFIQAVEKAGLRTVVIPERRALDTGVLSLLRDAVREAAPDLVQTHSIKSHFLLKTLGLHRARPWIAFHHGYTTTDVKMRLYNQLDRYSLRSAAHVVTVCQEFAQELRRIGVPPERLTVQHNMIKPFVRPGVEELEALRVLLKCPAGAPILLCIGRLSQEKGHADLLRAAARLRQTSPELDFRLILVGDGPERSALERLGHDLGVEDRILFAGYQENVAAYYAIADVYVLPSHSEGSPNTLLEALVAGVPCVATRVGGVSEIAAHEQNAWLVPKGDVAGLAEGIGRILTDTRLRKMLSQNGYRIAPLYTPLAYRNRMIGLYQRLLSR